MMKMKLLGISLGLFAATLNAMEQSDDWLAVSVERQFDKTSELTRTRSKRDELSQFADTQDDASLSNGQRLDTSNREDSDAENHRDNNTQHTPLSSPQLLKNPGAKKLEGRPQLVLNSSSYWIYDGKVAFLTDRDGDRFYSEFSVEFDADTEFLSSQVYARLYLGRDEVFKEFHSTANFFINSDSSEDTLVVESQLVSGFAPADYEVLIELYQASTNQLVAVLDGTSDADLYLLPLESQNFEQDHLDTVVVVHESGGSSGVGTIAWLCLGLMTRLCWRRWHPEFKLQRLTS
jgi:hypothetical protein